MDISYISLVNANIAKIKKNARIQDKIIEKKPLNKRLPDNPYES